MIAKLEDELAPELITRNSIGYESAVQPSLTTGDNSGCLQSEPSFAALCGIAPYRLSGKVCRYRLNRGSNRAANRVLHIISIGRLRTIPVPRPELLRLNEGHLKLEAIRCLKRYIAREVLYIIQGQQREINATQNRLLTRRRASGAHNTFSSAIASGSQKLVLRCLWVARTRVRVTPWPGTSIGFTRLS